MMTDVIQLRGWVLVLTLCALGAAYTVTVYNRRRLPSKQHDSSATVVFVVPECPCQTWYTEHSANSP